MMSGREGVVVVCTHTALPVAQQHTQASFHMLAPCSPLTLRAMCLVLSGAGAHGNSGGVRGAIEELSGLQEQQQSQLMQQRYGQPILPPSFTQVTTALHTHARKHFCFAEYL